MSLRFRWVFVLLFIAACSAGNAVADTQPEILHYRFSGTGLTTPNLASDPPPFTGTAFIGGSYLQTGTDLELRGDGHSLVSSSDAASSVIDHVDTQWVPDLTLSPSWTISFVTEALPNADVGARYVFGEEGNRFRCFTGGVAGVGNWILRGTFVTDVLLTGGASMERRRNTFVYDSTQNRILGYVDGVQVADVAQAGFVGFFNSAEAFKVAGYGSGFGSSAVGLPLPAGALLDDFRMYSRALSAQEVAEIGRHSIVIVSGNDAFIEDGDTSPDVADGSDFGSVPISSVVERTFMIINGGDLPMTLGAVAIDGTEAQDFSVLAQPQSPLAGGDGSDFTVRFAAGGEGLRSATLRFVTDDPEVDSFDFAVQGQGETLPDEVFAHGFES